MTSNNIAPLVIIHAGHGLFKRCSGEEARLQLHRIVQKVYVFLRKGKPAIEAATYGCMKLENVPAFNAGTGSVVQSDGKIRMSAGLIDSKSQLFSGVINIRDVKNPVRIAYLLQQDRNRVLADDGAIAYARGKGVNEYNPMTKQAYEEYLQKRSHTHGTVGCVVRDKYGVFAAATSTGGLGNELPGRVSDSPTVAGTYANENGGISCTGIGEEITSDATAATLVTLMNDRDWIEKSCLTVNGYKKKNREYSFIGLHSSGHMFWSTTTAFPLNAAWCNGEIIGDSIGAKKIALMNLV